MGMINDGLTSFLNGMGGASRVVLGMILGGMMGISFDNMPGPVQAAAKLLPVTYINRDFYTVWNGERYNFAPMLQSYLLLGAVAGILMFFALKRMSRKLH